MATLDDLINVSFSNAEVNTIMQALDTINNVLDGKTVNLTPEQRSQYGRINNNTEDWIRKIEAYMNEEPQLIPFYLKKSEFDADMKARDQIKPMLRKIRAVNEGLSDTAILLSADIYNAAIAYYRNIKITALQNVPGTTGIYQDLSAQFPGRPSVVIEEPATRDDGTEVPENDELD